MLTPSKNSALLDEQQRDEQKLTGKLPTTNIQGNNLWGSKKRSGLSDALDDEKRDVALQIKPEHHDHKRNSKTLCRKIVYDLFWDLIILIVTYILTFPAPLRRFYINTSDDPAAYAHPIPPDDNWGVMATFLWIVPLVLLVLVTGVVLQNPHKVLLHIVYFIHTSALVIFVTALLRFFFPEPRPFFGTLCGYGTDPVMKGWSDDPSICKVRFEDRDLQSFPSGHASSCWTSYTYLVLIFTSMMGAFRRSGEFWKIASVSTLFMVPIWISGDRIITGNHFAMDVLFGLIVGVLISFLSFFNLEKELLTK